MADTFTAQGVTAPGVMADGLVAHGFHGTRFDGTCLDGHRAAHDVSPLSPSSPPPPDLATAVPPDLLATFGPCRYHHPTDLQANLEL
jgi:hypothetical protein